MFIDRTKITIKSGDGGDGIVSFRREKYVPAGGPDGGNGGKGGDIIFRVDKGTNTLASFKYKRKFFAEDGQKGGKKKMSGKSGQDLIISVPLGTVISVSETNRVLADMANPDEERVILRGGKGGAGNYNYATATRQIPNFAKAGTPGIELEVTLELKMLADIGLVGFPNVGKSTLLSVTTNAEPEIDNYHFTTLSPNLGVYTDGDTSFVLADIPGLIEGASKGLGLGHRFLRHIERTRLIIHLIDMAGSEGRDPFDDFLKINKELEEYKLNLSTKPQIIAANKMDIAGSDENLEIFKEKLSGWLLENDLDYRVFEISAYRNIGTRELMLYAGSLLENIPKVPMIFEEEEVIHIAKEEDDINIYVDEEGVFVVEGQALINLLNRVNLQDHESAAYFQSSLRKMGIIDKLIDLGVEEGDTVRIYEMEFDYLD